MANDGIESIDRVADCGEVLTPENIVNDMLDLVKDESYRLDSKFLEPSCGNGNFLVKILERKLETASKLDREDFDKNIFIAVSSIYAIDIIPINIGMAKKRMMKVVECAYKNKMGTGIKTEMGKVIKYVLDTNIILGDTLTGMQGDNLEGLQENTQQEEIVIAEWNLDGDNVDRKDFTLNSLTNIQSHNTAVYEYKQIAFRKIYSLPKKITKKSADLFNEL